MFSRLHASGRIWWSLFGLAVVASLLAPALRSQGVAGSPRAVLKQARTLPQSLGLLAKDKPGEKGKKKPKPEEKPVTPAGWYDDFETARAAAAARERPLFVVFRCFG